MRQSNKRHGNRVFKTWYRVMGYMRQSNKRRGNRVIKDMVTGIQDMVIG